MRTIPLVTVLAAVLCARVRAENATAAVSVQRARAAALARLTGLAINNDAVDTQNRTVEEFMAARLAAMANTQIGLVTAETIDMDNVVVHPSTVVETVDSHLIRAGHDPVARALAFCHEHDICYFPSIRMNDVHDSMNNPGNWRRWSLWKREHLEYLLGQPGDFQKSPHYSPSAWWSAKNFEVQEVRDRQFMVLQEMCAVYDLDGLELDFLRAPIYFPPTRDMKPVTRQHLEIMNGFLRRLRTMTERAGREGGRPLLVAVRVPMSVERSLAIGLDLQTWLEEDLIDVLVAGGGYAPMAMAPSVKAMVDFARPYAVPVYACISSSGMKAQQGWDTVEAYRGAAMNVYHAGARVYLFNFPYGLLPDGKGHQYSMTQTSPKQAQLYTELGSAATLRGLDKVYGVDWIVEDRFQGCSRPGLVVPDRLPLALKPGGTVTVKLPVGENIVANAPAGRAPRARLRLRLSHMNLADEVTLRFNGKTLTRDLTAAPATDEPVAAASLSLYLHLPKQKRYDVASANQQFEITTAWRECGLVLTLPDAAALRGAKEIQLRAIVQLRSPCKQVYLDDAVLAVAERPPEENLLINPDFEQGHEAGETVPGWRGSGYDGSRHTGAEFVIAEAGRNGSRAGVLSRASNQVWVLADQHALVAADAGKTVRFSVRLRADAPPRLEFDVDPALVRAGGNEVELALGERPAADGAALERLALAVDYR